MVELLDKSQITYSRQRKPYSATAAFRKVKAVLFSLVFFASFKNKINKTDIVPADPSWPYSRWLWNCMEALLSVPAPWCHLKGTCFICWCVACLITVGCLFTSILKGKLRTQIPQIDILVYFFRYYRKRKRKRNCPVSKYERGSLF